MRHLLLLLLVVLAALLMPRAAAQYGATPHARSGPTNLVCIVCGKGPLIGRVWKFRDDFVCDDCAKIETRCSLCALPAKDGFGKTTDGRILCKRCLPGAVLKADEARRIYDDAVSGMLALAGTAVALRSTNFSVSLFDVDYWNTRNGQPVPNEMRRMGFSQSRRIGNAFTHTVVLLSGQPRADMAAVCAHEYAHLWINENKPDSREIEPDTIEAVCELFAYKLVTARKDAAGQDRIRKNPYTHGRIETMITAEAATGFNAVLEWVKSGTAKTLGGPAVPAVATVPRPAVTSPPPPAPRQLELTGLIGGRFPQAIINGVPFTKGDEFKVKLADKTVTVKCLEFSGATVTLRVDGAEKPVTLRMDGR